MLAFRAISSPTLLRTSSSCLRFGLPLRSPLRSSFVFPTSHYDSHTQTRLFTGSSFSPFPRVPRSNPQTARQPSTSTPKSEQLESRIQSQTPIETDEPPQINRVARYLTELAKEEEARFERDVARFRAQAGMSPPTPSVQQVPRNLSQDSLSGVRKLKDKENGEEASLLPRFREEVLKEDPTLEQPKFEDGLGRPGIWKQITFAGLFTLFVFAYAAEATNFDTKRLSAVFPSPFMVSSEQLRRVRLSMLSEQLKKKLQKLKEALSALPNSLAYPMLWSYVQLANGYINSSEGKRIAYQIVAINALVWGLWQVRVLRPFMTTNFTHHPLSGKAFTMLTSTFSHQSLLHLLANSFALVSFGSAATSYLVKKQQENKDGVLESTPKYHFWALFIGAGLFSSLTSHIVNARVLFPRLLAESRAFKSAEALSVSSTSGFRRVGSAAKDKAGVTGRSGSPQDIRPSLGASGAIYATVTLTALAYPDAQVFLLFPPVPLPITWGVGGMVALDVVGILRGWRLFDHWAHLSGAAFGAWYYKYGPDMWNSLRATYARVNQNSAP